MINNTIKKLKLSKRRNLSLVYIGILMIFSLLVGFFINYLFSDYYRQSSLAGTPIVRHIRNAKAADSTQSTNVKAVSTQATKSATYVIPKNSGRSVKVPILYYHYIGNNPNPIDKVRDALSVTPDKFEAQMSYVSSHGFNTISLDTLYAALKGGSLPSNPIVLTFDDGYVDFYLNAYPILRKYNLHATSFIPTGLMGQGYYLSWSQIKEMDASNLISFEAHSVSHVNLASLGIDQLKHQVFDSKKTLQDQLGKPVNFFAYPYGGSNPTVWEVVKEAGFVGAVGTWASSVESEGSIYNWPRIRIGSSWSIEEFARRI